MVRVSSPKSRRATPPDLVDQFRVGLGQIDLDARRRHALAQTVVQVAEAVAI
jgi:hypothetical protein